jgi:hypothetical protein
MNSMSSSLAGTQLSHSVRVVRFNRKAQSMFPVEAVTSNVLSWFAVVAVFAFVAFIAIMA